jgi:hypothetical protein
VSQKLFTEVCRIRARGIGRPERFSGLFNACHRHLEGRSAGSVIPAGPDVIGWGKKAVAAIRVNVANRTRATITTMPLSSLNRLMYEILI